MVLQRQHKHKGSTFVLPAPGYNDAVMSFNDFFCNVRSNSCSVISLSWMQSLKDRKDLFGILVIETNSIVADDNAAVVVVFRSLQLLMMVKI
jgi:hypothetical protein